MAQKVVFPKGRESGFTLIELLVVIAIIALLMSILLPGLGKARDHAKYILCSSRLRQFGIMFEMYGQDNRESLPGGWNSGKMWMVDLLPYYKGEGDVRLCPKAKQFLSDKDPATCFIPDVFTAWGKFGEGSWSSYDPEWAETGMYGSFGINGWAHNPPDIGTVKNPDENYDIDPVDRPKYWRKTINVKRPDTVPLMGDALWDGSTPEKRDRPSSGAGVMGSDISVFCVPRHNGKVNMMFMDKSVRKVGIKELWSLKWNTEWKEPHINWNQYEWIGKYPE